MNQKTTIVRPDYHAWKKQFKQERGREPTAYEAWCASADHCRDVAADTSSSEHQSIPRSHVELADLCARVSPPSATR